MVTTWWRILRKFVSEGLDMSSHDDGWEGGLIARSKGDPPCVKHHESLSLNLSVGGNVVKRYDLRVHRT